MDQTLGYARVSTADQNPDLHVDELTAAGCHRIFVEHATGARAEDRNWPRPSTTRSGDILGVWRLDRLARSLRDLIEVVTDLEQRGVGFRTLHERVRSDPRAGVVRTPVASPRSDPRLPARRQLRRQGPFRRGPRCNPRSRCRPSGALARGRFRHAAWHSAVAQNARQDHLRIRPRNFRGIVEPGMSAGRRHTPSDTKLPQRNGGVGAKRGLGAAASSSGR
jgi:hypothetical protein